MDAARPCPVRRGEAPGHVNVRMVPQFSCATRHALTNKAKDLTAVMIEQFRDAAGLVDAGRARTRRQSRSRTLDASSLPVRNAPGAAIPRLRCWRKPLTKADSTAMSAHRSVIGAHRGPGFAGTTLYSGIFRYSRLLRLASSRSRSRSMRRLVSSVILPSRSSAWMNFRSAAINSRVSAVPAAETSWASGSSESGSWLAADLVPGAQELYDFVGEFAVVGDGIERLERGIERLAPRRDFGFMFRDMLLAAVLGDAEPSHHQRQPRAQVRPA